MVVAGLLTGIQNDAPILDYEILATQALGDYKVEGQYNTSKVCCLLLINHDLDCEKKSYLVTRSFLCDVSEIGISDPSHIVGTK